MSDMYLVIGCIVVGVLLLGGNREPDPVQTLAIMRAMQKEKDEAVKAAREGRTTVRSDMSLLDDMSPTKDTSNASERTNVRSARMDELAVNREA